MGKARNERGAQPDGFTEARRSLSFWWTVFRVVAVVGAALSILTLNRDGEVFAWAPSLSGFFSSFAIFLDTVFGPVESALNWLMARLDWDLTLGYTFKPTLLASWMALGAALRINARYGSVQVIGWVIAFAVALVFASALSFLEVGDDNPIVLLVPIVALLFGALLAMVTPSRSGESREIATEILYILVATLSVFAMNYLFIYA